MRRWMGRSALVVLLLVGAVVLAGCCAAALPNLRGALRGVRGSGQIETRTFDLANFGALEISHTFRVEVTQGDEYAVEVSADDNLFEYLEVARSGDTLRLGLRDLTSYVNTTATARVTMPRLTALKASGASQAQVRGFQSGDPLALDTSGASRIEGEITFGEGDFNLSGASQIVLTGEGDHVRLKASGASRADLGGMPLRSADVTLSGASSAVLDVSDTLDVTASGGSSVTYSGGARVGRRNLSGGSSLNAR